MPAFSSILGAGSLALSAISGNRAEDAAEAGQAFSLQQYEDWKDIFGDIEQNVSDFYKNLTGEQFATYGLEAQEKEFNTARTRLRETLAQRDIDETSGAALELEKQLELENVKAKAKIRTEAPLKATQLKEGFLASGRGQQARSQQNVLSSFATEAEREDEASAGFGAAAGKLLSIGLGNIADATPLTATPDLTT